MRRRSGNAATLMLALSLVAAGGWACGDGATLNNSCPRINHVGDAQWEGDVLVVGIWLQDLEEDPVDLVVTGADGTIIENVGGHGIVGLTSAYDEPGAVHALEIPKAAIGANGTLSFEPTDPDGCTGEPVVFEVPVR